MEEAFILIETTKRRLRKIVPSLSFGGANRKRFDNKIIEKDSPSNGDIPGNLSLVWFERALLLYYASWIRNNVRSTENNSL